MDRACSERRALCPIRPKETLGFAPWPCRSQIRRRPSPRRQRRRRPTGHYQGCQAPLFGWRPRRHAVLVGFIADLSGISHLCLIDRSRAGRLTVQRDAVGEPGGALIGGFARGLVSVGDDHRRGLLRFRISGRAVDRCQSLIGLHGVLRADRRARKLRWVVGWSAVLAYALGRHDWFSLWLRGHTASPLGQSPGSDR
jgi:hypothetical protein